MNQYPEFQNPDGLPKATYDALLGLQRNGKSDATAAELRDVIESLGLYRKQGRPVPRIDKGQVNARLAEMAGRGLVIKVPGVERINPLTGKPAAVWRIQPQQGDLVGFRNPSTTGAAQ